MSHNHPPSSGRSGSDTTSRLDFRDIFESSPKLDLLVDTDPPQFTMLAVTDRFVRLVGLERHELIGHGIFEVFPESPRGEQHLLREALETVVERGEPRSLAAYRFDLRDPDAPEHRVERYWSPSLIPLFGDDGQVDTILLRVEEATDFVLRERFLYERSSTEEPPREKHRSILLIEPRENRRTRLASAFETHWNVRVATDTDEAEAILDQFDADLVVTTLALPDADGLDFIARLDQTSSVPILARIDQSDGRYFRQAFEAGADDVVGGPVGIRELLARVQVQLAEATLREVTHERIHRQYRRLFKQAPVGIALLEGPEHVFTLSNPAYDEIVGHRPLVELTVREAFPEENLRPFFERLDEVYETGEPFFAHEVPADTRPGETLQSGPEPHLTFAYLPYRDADGAVTGVAVFAWDVTEHVAMRRAIERESERKDEFLAMLGHELRNPLTPIAHASELLKLKDGELDTELLEWITDTIDRQVQQLTHHVDELLDIARIRQGRIDIERSQIPVEQFVTGAVEAVQADIDGRDQQLSVSLPDPPVDVNVDPARITQVLTNLLTNSSQHTPAGGDIALEAQLRDDPDDQTLVLRVRDDGEGIESDVLSDIFEPFTQANVELARSRGGLGLGLALVKEIVELHDGTVTAHSPGPGEGSCFVAELPVEVSPIRGDTGAEQPSDSLEQTRVLIVDDNRDVAEVLALQLEALSATVFTANSGAEALEIAENRNPTDVLLDIGLPDIDGYEVAARLRELPDGNRLQITAITGYGLREDIEKAHEAGFDEYLTKPVDPDTLLDVLRAGPSDEED